MRSLTALFTLAAVLLLAGCPAAIIGGGAVAYGTIEDRRTSGTMIDDDSIETRVSRGVRERLVAKERAPQEPYDHGRLEIVEEPWVDEPGAQPARRLPLAAG